MHINHSIILWVIVAVIFFSVLWVFNPGNILESSKEDENLAVAGGLSLLWPLALAFLVTLGPCYAYYKYILTPLKEKNKARAWRKKNEAAFKNRSA